MDNQTLYLNLSAHSSVFLASPFRINILADALATLLLFELTPPKPTQSLAGKQNSPSKTPYATR